MCIALNYANEINKQITEAKEYYSKLSVKQKVFDGVQQDLLHKIEDLDKFSLYTGWKFCKALSNLRKARRKTKNEIKTMSSLISQLGNFQIKEKKLDEKASEIEKINFENGYHKRQLEMTGDILKEVDDIVNNIINSEGLVDDYLESNINQNNNGDRIYEITQTVPKDKGSNIKVRFSSEKQKEGLIKSRKPAYKRYVVNDNAMYVEFIDRKKKG